MSSDDFTREPLGIGPRRKELDRQLKAADREALGNISAGLAQAISHSVRDDLVEAMDAKTLAENLHRVQEHLKHEVAQSAWLRSLLREYGRHQEGCDAHWGDRYRCRCGWRDVEAEFMCRNSA